MEKLSLIVPLSRIRSSFYTKFFLFYLLFDLFFIEMQAQTYGCHVVRGMSNVLYYTPYGNGPPSEWTTTGVVDKSGAEGGYKYDRTASFGCIADIGPSCTVYQQYLMPDGVSVGTRVYKFGQYASVDQVNCPIDNYVFLLFLFTTGFAILRIKKQCHFANENIHHHRRIQWSRFYRRVY